MRKIILWYADHNEIVEAYYALNIFRCVGVTLFAYYEKIAMIAIDEGELFQDNVEQLEYDCDEVKECR